MPFAFTARGPLAIPAAGYTANGVHFDGTNDSMTIASLSGIADGKKGIVSFWFKMTGGDGNFQILWETDDQTAFTVQRFNNGKWLVNGADSGNATTLSILSSTTYTSSMSDWAHFAASWDGAAGSPYAYMFVDGVDVSSSVTIPSGNDIDYNEAGGDWHFGNRVGGSLKVDMDIAEFYFNTAEALDISNATNLQKFRSAGGAPVSLGSDGSTPTGTAPIVYLKGPAASWPTNAGTGCNFTASGTITDSADNPP
jgi:hypothetical protein